VSENETIVINGPVAGAWSGGIIYSITLGNGFIVTSPGGFGTGESEEHIAPRRLPSTGISVPLGPAPIGAGLLASGSPD